MRLYGKNPVLERLKTNPRTIKKIYMELAHHEAGYILKKARKWGIPVHQVPRSKLQKLARNINTQGIVVEVDGFAYAPYEEVLEDARKNRDTIIFTDGLNDPQNLGSIVRSLACLGHFSIVIPSHGSVEVTEVVLRIACGGENYIKIAKVANMSQAIHQAREEGIFIIGSVVGEGEEIGSIQFPFPCALIIGSEQKGVRPQLQKLVDKTVTIPMAHERLAMNAAHATTIISYEINKQRQRK